MNVWSLLQLGTRASSATYASPTGHRSVQCSHLTTPPSPQRRGRNVAVAALVIAGAQARASATPNPPAADRRLSLAALPAAGTIVLDGALTEPAWQSAPAFELAQQSPRPGEPTKYRTTVRVLVDSEILFFGLVCEDPEPKRISVHTLQRDADLTADDTVSLVLDTFLDHRTAYFFSINAGGARTDGLISGVDELSRDWDGIWDAAVRPTAEGWTAEIAIPTRTLRFPKGAAVWGWNVERSVPRDLLVLRAADLSLDARLDDLSRAGELSGLSALQQGLGLSITPYVLGEYFDDRTTGRRFVKGQAGGDVRYSFAPQLDGVMTVRPDFAETEADARQINLTRFPLFFPEKRAFFLEGSNLFRFGLGLADEFDFLPFYSRRVGLYQNSVVPIDFGAKVVGQAGRWGIAALDTAMAEGGGAQRTNLFAGRLTYDVDEHLRLGAIGTEGDPSGARSNSLGGLDAIWRTSHFQEDKNLAIGVWGAGTAGDLPPGRSTGWGVKVAYPNDLWDVSLRYEDYGDALDPGLGFLPRPGTRQYRLGVAYQPRPRGGPFGWVRQFFFELFPTLIENQRGQVETWRVFLAPFNVRTESGAHLEANYAPEFERLFEPFEVFPGVVIPVGSYRFDRFRLEAESPDSKPLRVGATVWFGDFFSGTLTQVIGFAHWTGPSGRVQLGLDAENDFGHLPEGDFIDRLWQLRAVYSFSPDLFFQTFVQYDSGSRTVGMNSLVRWTVEPGRDLFLVWNRNWLSPLEGGTANLRTLADQVVLKLRWTFRR